VKEAVIEGEKVAANIVDDGYGPPVAEVQKLHTGWWFKPP